MPPPTGADPRPFVVIGTTVVAKRVCGTLASLGEDVLHLAEPTEDDLRAATARRPRGVAILVHDDVACLRYALTVAHMRPQVRLVVSIFDRTVAEQLRRVMPACVIASPADVAAPTLAAACLNTDLLAVWRAPDGPTGVRRTPDGFAVTGYPLPGHLRWRTRLGRLRGQLRPHDSGSRMLLAGLAGLAAVLSADWLWLFLRHHLDPVTALYEAVRVVATVGPADDPGTSVRYRLFAAAAMLATIVFTAVFTAGIVHRALNGRTFGLIGHRAPPVDGHVVVVGMGQVGLRLCLALKDLGIGVVAVERDPDADNLRIAKQSRVPVLVAHGSDRRVLTRLRLHRAIALAVVGSDELDNIAVALTGLAVAPRVRVVLRAGDSEAMAETRSLFRIAEIRDVTAMSATFVVLALRRVDPAHLCSDGLHVYAQLGGAEFAECTSGVAAACRHLEFAPGAAG
ncbi:NAD-binding protein [Longispora sp. NPDC051575]|uniref:NAD-binding protein n=1 Tax=Longispora sp. NPDC051575 TaxID=3154943 RepID=UPI00342CF569